MDNTKPEWLLVIYVTIDMIFFTLVGYSVDNVITGVKIGVFMSLATSVAIGFRIVIDHYTSKLVLTKKEDKT
jgi:hypothetical protein